LSAALIAATSASARAAFVWAGAPGVCHRRSERHKIHPNHTGCDHERIGLERNEERCRACAESTKAQQQGSVDEREYNPRNLTWLKQSEKWVMKGDAGTKLYPVEKVCIGEKEYSEDQDSQE
jgi:hypothetical protein